MEQEVNYAWEWGGLYLLRKLNIGTGRRDDYMHEGYDDEMFPSGALPLPSRDRCQGYRTAGDAGWHVLNTTAGG